MADNRNFAALDWLIHEIGETLKEARQALEAYVENPKDAVRIRFCLTHIHQVHGSLQMVEFFGAAMLAEEMERLTQAMIQGSVSNASEAQEVLMRAILQFPVYLEQVKATRKDNPLVVLPLLNDLRAVRGESLLTDTKLFVPNLAPAKKVSGPRNPAAQDNVQFQAMALKLRQMYQYAAAGYIRGVNTDENLAYLQKAFNRLHKLTQGTARHALWDICLALAEALEIDAIEISVAVKNLLRQLDKEIKILAVHGTKALNSYTNDELIKNLLYYVARAGKHAPGFAENSHLQRIYTNYHLDDALIEGKESGEDSTNILSAPDSEAMRSVAEALKTELDIIKNALDVCISGGDPQQILSDALPVVKRIADTLAVLGLGELRKQILEQGAVLELVKNTAGDVSSEELMAVAARMIHIENSLDNLVQSHATHSGTASANDADITLTRAKESVLRESRNGLEHAKDAIIEYIASQWDRSHLQSVPETLREIRGGLEILPLPRAARVLSACARYIDEQLLAQAFAPQWSSLDTLADAITSVEYYLERLSSGATKEENDLLLTVAEESVASLGYAVAKTIRPEALINYETAAVDFAEQDAFATEHAEPVLQDSAEEDAASLAAAYQAAMQPIVAEANEELDSFTTEPAPASLFNSLAPTLGNQYPQPEAAITITPVISHPLQVTFSSAAEPEALNETLSEELSPAVSEDITLEPLNAEVQEPYVADVIEAVDTQLENEHVVDLTHPEVVAETPVVNISAQDDDDENYIDDEIIEIFVEEAGEVSEAISKYFPRWAENFNDHESLLEFRRAFHTLKGSGRMVGANDIGELAWSIENMLNRILDKTIEPQQVHVAIIEKVRVILPSMIDAFSHHQDNPHPDLTSHYRALAEDLARGIVSDEMLELVADAIATEEIKNTEPSSASEANEVEAFELEEAIDLEEVVNVEDTIDLEDIIEIDMAPVEESHEEVARATSTSIDLEDDSLDDADMQLWDIFSAEALTHLQAVEEYIAHMEAEAPCYEPPSDGIQRALHTLKGSAHMAEITPIAELAAPLEKFVKELRSYHVNINDDILQLLRDAVSYTNSALEQISQGQLVEIPRLQQFIARVNELRDIHVAPLVRQQEMDENGKRPVDPELLAIFMAEEMNLLLDADQIIEQWKNEPSNIHVLHPIVGELRNLTRGAHHAYLPAMASLGEKLEHVYVRILDQRLTCTDPVCTTLIASHTALLDMVDAIAAGQNLVDAPSHITEALQQLIDVDSLSIADYSAEVEPLADVEEVVAELPILEEETLSADFLPESLVAEEVNSADEYSLIDEDTAPVDLESDYADLPSIEVEIDEPEEGMPALIATIESEPEYPVLEETIDLGEEIILDAEPVVLDLPISDAIELLEEETPHSEISLGEELSIEELAVDENEESVFTELPVVEDELPTLHESIIADEAELILLENIEDDIPVLESEYVVDFAAAENEPAFAEPEEISVEPLVPFKPEVALSKPEVVARPKIAAADDDDFDPEIIEIFIEEAGELLEDMERALHDWQENWNNPDCAEELKRCLHTFKGGARLAGLTELGDLSHNFETVLIDMNPDSDIDQAFFKHLNSYQDRLHAGVDYVSAKLNGELSASEELDEEDITQAVDEIEIEEVSSFPVQDQSADTQAPETDVNLPAIKPTLVVDNSARISEPNNAPTGTKPNVLTFAPKPKPVAAPLPKIPGSEYAGMKGSGQSQHLAARRTGPQEVVKVSAELLEELVNLAGETSISRGRMEQQVSDLSGSIEEMDATIHRLQEQLRRLDIETEAQVLFRQEQMAQHEEFDPLEMDRYSQLQQLSRSLIESASDLMDLKYTLADKTRDTETLLLQQSRINTDLQEGLMRSRMVPFSRLVPRLRRIVRQAATELNKDVEFELDNVEGELDRTVLERMVAPLEHMLRNAVDHGIESPEQRQAAGKTATGRIVLTLGREGGDVILRLTDDGRGINLQRVREKALERGLMAEDAQLSDQDLMQFILHAGFSTADKVTQISGRGVGMDVVHSEIKQLGGSMVIDSNWGYGTEFIIRLPFTVSVNRALMVQIGDDLYAIPLNTIEGIVRVSPFELEHYYQDEDARFDYAGDNYHVRYLGAMLESDAKPKLDGQSLPLPVVLVRSAENTVALQVDRLLGSREIVVKTLGAQFSAVRGVSGATVMGDGSVVVILDLHALIREQIALGLGRTILLEPVNNTFAAEEEQAEKVVMVVDDSVTVRKVTGRFLEREGFRVIAAKDGIEALQLLQDHIPDVMLLDIEMPRMDGFEVAKNIRTSSRLKDIPIIMITSRTGEKHRERAFELGVNKYMGKPYQEDLLLTNIKELIKNPVN